MTVLYRLIRMRLLGIVIVTALPPLLTGCTSFATVRSAEIQPGPSLAIQASASTPPGEVAYWFWSYDCAQDCDYPVLGGDVGLTYGWARHQGPGAFALGVGLNGIHPYVDGYLQLGTGRRPFGVGARVGPLWNWREHQLYGRFDVPLSGTTRLLLNPALFIHEGRAANGQIPGSFIGFVQGIGLLLEGDHVTWTPAIALVAGRAQRNSYGEQFGPERSVFGAASLGVTFHRQRIPTP